jgi:hypothetical protein
MMEQQSTLGYYLNRAIAPKNAVKDFGSVESLLGSILPPGSLNEKNEKPAAEKKEDLTPPEPLDLSEKLKDFAEKSLLTTEEKRLIERVDEEIEKDLQEAFVNESISLQEAATANYYKLYRDRDESFECKVNVEGAALSNSVARLILETDIWNIMFQGKIYKDGRCVIPLKKMSIFPEGTIGKAHLEIIIDDMVFIPWEDSFRVEGAKKVTVEIAPQGKVSVNLKDE